MIHPKSIMFCTEPSLTILDNLPKKIDTIHLYVDLKNSSNSLFIPDVVNELVDEYLKNKNNSVKILESIFLTISNWKIAAKHRKLNIKIFFCNDIGKSKYHLSINKEYKANRGISNKYISEDYAEKLSELKYKNWENAKNICNKIPNVYFINLTALESDFIPYYYITRHFNENDNIFHIISSNDKDHYQILNLPNTIMFYRKSGEDIILNKKSYLNKFIKLNKLNESQKTNMNLQTQWIDLISKFNSDYITVLMSFCGDTSDNVKGLYKVGEKTALKMLCDSYVTNTLLGDIESIETRILNGENLLLPCSKEFYNGLDKYWKLAYDQNELVTKAYKQISYESLVRWLEKSSIKDNYLLLEKIIQKENLNLNEKHQQYFVDSILSNKYVVLTEQNLISVF